MMNLKLVVHKLATEEFKKEFNFRILIETRLNKVISLEKVRHVSKNLCYHLQS